MLLNFAAVRTSAGEFGIELIDALLGLLSALVSIVVLYLVIKYAVRAGVLLALRQFEREGGNLARIEQPPPAYQQPTYQQPAYNPTAYPVPRNFEVVDDTPR